MMRRWIGLGWLLCWLAAPAMAQGPDSAPSQPGPSSARQAKEHGEGGAASASGTAASAASTSDEALPTATVLKTQVPSEAEASMGRAMERTIRARLGDLDVVETQGTPGLGLRDLQLAVGCTADTNACLKVVADKLETDALLLSSVERVDDSLVLTLTFFNAAQGSRREVVRRESGDEAGSKLLDLLPGALRELFDLPPAEPEPGFAPPEPEEAGQEQETAQPSSAAAAKSAESRLSPYPFVVAGAGVAALATGVIVGVLSDDAKDEYANTDPQTKSEVRAAHDDFERADRMAKSANALFGIGAALTVGGTALFLILERDRLFGTTDRTSQANVRVTPAFSARGGGLVLRGRLWGSE